MTATVSVRGQVVIPAEIRKKYHIKPKTKVDFIDTEKGIYLLPVSKDPVKEAYGMWKRMGVNISSADLIHMRRDERKKERAKYKRLYGIR